MIFFKNIKIKDKTSMENSQAFCMLPWVHLYINTQGKVTPCCLSPWDEDKVLGDINEQPLEKIWNGKKMMEIRSKMLRDKKNDGCRQCYENEKSGLRSKREISNFCYQHKLGWVQSTKKNGYSTEAKPIYWDIRISNLCNFKCRICGHHSSSKLYDEAKTLGELSFPERVHYSMKDFDRAMGQLQPVVPFLEEIYFAGGEPLIMEEHYQILDMLIAHKKFDVKLRYATNFSTTVFKGRDVFELWNNFTEVFVHASLDGSHEKGEYQRKGQVWDNVLQERRRMLEVCPQVNFMICSATSVFNVLHLPEFHKEWTENGLVAADDFMPHTLKNPAVYNIKILPPAMKQKVQQLYQEHIKWLKTFPQEDFIKIEMVALEFEGIVSYMNSEDWTHLIPAFREKCELLDNMRMEKTIEVFPELVEILI
ncbi:MAG: twitch domain-containing radical SAM protein [Saprospiraceae bacterium]